MGSKKTALLLCKCGTNLANFVDLDAVAEWARKRGDIALVETHNLLCSPDGKKFFAETIKDKGLDSVVVAACSPKMHEKTFQDIATGVGLNMAQVQMANIREQCGWVTSDKGEATAKSKALINAAAQRSWLAEALEKRSMKVNTDVVVIGGGVAGIEAALLAAQGGRTVTIVDREISLGGSVIKTEEVAPNMECAPCLLAPRLAAVKENPNIRVVANAEVRQVVGFYGNFTVTIQRRAQSVEPSCIGCEACFEVCPVETVSDFHLGLGKRKAIYTQFPGSVPATAAIDTTVCKHFTDGSCDACVAACPFGSIKFDQADEEMQVAAGAIVVATGFANAGVEGLAALGHGKLDGVHTLPEFERLASSNGPSGGQVKLKDGKPPMSVAVVHCAGSLREDGVPYCSRVCCMNALKVGELVRKQNPDAKVYNIHNDLVFASPTEMEFYREQVGEGTTMVRCTDLSSVGVSDANGKLRVVGDGMSEIVADMVVLATGMVPSAGTAELAALLNIDLARSGFFKPDHPLLHATGASLDGIYIAGCAAGPCGVAEAVTRGRSAAGDALSKLVEGREIELEIMTSVIDEDLCGGCKLCITVCPYKAVSFDSEKRVSVVNEAICRGCGTCTASCPTGASKARHFTDEQIYAEIGGVLNG